ncbi:MAG: TolC family protein, partial [Bacteroidia bacterium]
LQMRANRIGYLPTVALFGSAQYQAQRTTFDIFSNKPWYPIVVVGLQVNVPIFDGLQRHHRIQQSRVGIAKAENDMFMIRQTIDLQMAIASANLSNSASSINTRQSNVDLAQRVYDVAKKKYEAGVGSNLEVLNAETALKEAQTNYFSALYDAVVAKVEYEKATGTLTFK